MQAVGGAALILIGGYWWWGRRRSAPIIAGPESMNAAFIRSPVSPSIFAATPAEPQLAPDELAPAASRSDLTSPVLSQLADFEPPNSEPQAPSTLSTGNEIEFRAQLAAGAMLVLWGDTEGHVHETMALSLSPDDVEFYVDDGIPERIIRLICSSLGVVIAVDQAVLEDTGRGSFVARFTDLRNGIDDKMLLIDLVTRLGGD